MLDTSAIGEFADGAIEANTLYTSSDRFYITHIQKDELAKAGDYAMILMKTVKIVDPDEEPTEAMMFGISKLDAAKLGAGEYIDLMIENMKPDDNNEKDALIAETAIQNGRTLVTDDKDLRKTVNENTPGSAISVSELSSRIE